MSDRYLEKPVIASTSLTAVEADGERFQLTIELHEPYLDADGVWRCAPSMRPLWDRLRHAAGEDSFQALCLAIALVRTLLENFVEEGGSLWLDDKPWPSQAYPMGAFQNL